MGEVWEAHDTVLTRPVAVKVIGLLAGGGSRGDMARARFQREARITAALQHPNIVTVHDLGEAGAAEGHAPFLVMELLRGESLHAVVRRGPVPLRDAARWGAEICDALTEAHRSKVLHRDIKPSNIQITPAGTVKVLDFGIARAADPYATEHRLTQTGFIVGTPPYMAPEQARGTPEPRSDLYSLGCLLFEMITGRLPFQAPDTMGYVTAHLTQPPPAPSSIRATVPSAWDDLVLTLLCKDPAQRYPSAADLADALRQLEQGMPPTPPRTGQPPAPPTLNQQTSATRVEPTSEVPGPFAISWTGKEPLSAYTNIRQTRLLVVGLTVALAVAVTGVVIGAQHQLWRDGQNITSSGWSSLLWSSLGFAVLVVIFLCEAAEAAFPRGKRSWSLQIGPPGIRTTHGPDRREYVWDQVQMFAIQEVASKVRVAARAGLYVKCAQAGQRGKSVKPAGWPLRKLAIGRQGMIPVCVLGPMSDQQRDALDGALARYGRGRGDVEAWGG